MVFIWFFGEEKIIPPCKLYFYEFVILAFINETHAIIDLT